jgi:hypothetical protein
VISLPGWLALVVQILTTEETEDIPTEEIQQVFIPGLLSTWQEPPIMAAPKRDRYKPGDELVAPWVQVKNSLVKQIKTGVLEPGDEVWLMLEAEDQGVSHSTAMKAFHVLVNEGMLESPELPGKPYRVPRKGVDGVQE